MTTETAQRQELEFVPVAKVGDIKHGEGKMVRPAAGRLRGKPLAIFNENGNFYIMNFVCPHSAGPISEGTIQDGVVTCPYHAWAYHADTGLPAGAHEHCISVYEVKMEGDDVLVGGMKQPPASD